MIFGIPFGTIAISCITIFCALVVIVHLLRQDLDPAAASLSTYFTGSSRSLMFVAYFFLAMALMTVAGMMLSSAGVWIGTVSAVLCVFAAANLVPVGITARKVLGDPDVRSPTAILIHRLSSLAAFALIVTAMVLYSAWLFALGAKTSLTLPILLVAVVALLTLIVVVTRSPGPSYGLIQKGLVALVVIWIVLVSM